MKNGSPRLEAVAAVDLKGRITLILVIAELAVFLLNIIEDLVVLTAWPDH
jgi:hypothetical protein